MQYIVGNTTVTYIQLRDIFMRFKVYIVFGSLIEKQRHKQTKENN